MTDKKKKTPPKQEHTRTNGSTYYTVPNQKKYCAKIPKPRKPFTALDHKYMKTAGSELSHGGIKLWIWFTCNSNNYESPISPAIICEEMKMHKNTYKNAVNELIKEGYLLQYKDTNLYHFVPDNTLRGMSKEDYFDWCDKTRTKGYQWQEEDFSDYEGYYCIDDDDEDDD